MKKKEKKMKMYKVTLHDDLLCMMKLKMKKLGMKDMLLENLDIGSVRQ
jgi:hypothetical protein